MLYYRGRRSLQTCLVALLGPWCLTHAVASPQTRYRYPLTIHLHNQSSRTLTLAERHTSHGRWVTRPPSQIKGGAEGSYTVRGTAPGTVDKNGELPSSELEFPYAVYSAGNVKLSLKTGVTQEQVFTDIRIRPVCHLPVLPKPYSATWAVLDQPTMSACRVDIYFIDGTSTSQPVTRRADEYPLTFTVRLHNSTAGTLTLKSSDGNWVTKPPTVIKAWASISYTTQGDTIEVVVPDRGMPDLSASVDYGTGAVDVKLKTVELSGESAVDPKTCDLFNDGLCTTWTHLPPPYSITARVTQKDDDTLEDIVLSDGSLKPVVSKAE